MNYIIGMEDESLQSYIFRTISLSGIVDFSSIISRDGEWNVFVQISLRHVSYFKIMPENRLLSLIKKNYDRYFSSGFNFNPFYYLELYKLLLGIDDVFTDSLKNSSLSRKKKVISFCKSCIIDGISRDGFGYFRSSWDTTTFCDNHKSPLYYLQPSTRTKRIKEIRLILQGQAPTTAKQYPIASDPKKLDYMAEQYFQLPVSPCLLKIISHKLRRVVSDYYYFPEEAYDEMNDRIMRLLDRRFLYKSGVYKELDYHKINQSLMDLIRLKYRPIEVYLTDLYEEVVAFNGVDCVASCSERMFAPKLRDCHKCEYSKAACALSPKIVTFVQPEQIIVARGENYCDRLIKNFASFTPRRNIRISRSNIHIHDEDFFVGYDFEAKQFQYDLIDLLP